MLFPTGLSAHSFTYNNWGTNPSSTPGTSVVPGTSNAEGSWTQIASSANISQDIFGFLLSVHNGNSNATAKNHLLDVGVDPAGGTSYTAVISNIVCGSTGNVVDQKFGAEFLFPLFIPSGSSVAVRVQGSHTVAGTVRVCAKFYGSLGRQEETPLGQFSETIGTITNSNGVSFTPGNAADGTWVSLGTTAKAMWWWQLAYQIDNGTVTAEQTYIELAHGDATNKHSIITLFHEGNSAETLGIVMGENLNHFAAYKPLPAGVELWVRGRCNNAPDSGYNAVAIGIGG